MGLNSFFKKKLFLIKIYSELRKLIINLIFFFFFRYSQDEEDKQWDSGGYYYPDNYAISSADNYQNQINKKRSSKKLPSTTGYSNTSQDDAYYTPSRGKKFLQDFCPL